MREKGKTMSDEYIEKEDAIQSIIAHDLVGGNARGWAEYLLEYTSTADVALVRHGRWVDVDRMQMHDLHGVLTWGNSFKCTECQFKTFAVEGHITQYNYCPNCGAKMDEGGSNGTDNK